MPDVTIVDETVIIRLSALERIAGILRDLAVPVSRVRDAHVAPDGLRAARGIRAPGLHLPGVNKYGTWRGSRGKTYVAVNGRRPALVLTLEGHAYERIVVTTADAEALLHQLRTVGAHLLRDAAAGRIPFLTSPPFTFVPPGGISRT